MINRAILAMLFCTVGWAGLDSKDVVKITSQIHGANQGKQHGSGIVFSWGDKAYALTSEHAVYHSNTSFTHSVWNEDIGSIPAKLLIAEYGNGLALLELSSVPKDLREWSTVGAVAPAKNMPVFVKGYGYSQRELTENGPGEILLLKSTSRVIPMVPDLIETTDAYGGYGMSGGPMVDGNKGDDGFVGILSHRPMKDPPGQPARAGDFSGDELERHLIVIPASVAKSWVESVLTPPTPPVPYFTRDTNGQMKGEEIILSSGLRFEIVQPTPPESPVGGGEGVGARVGSRHDAGIGGPELVQDQPIVRLSADNRSMGTNWYLPQRQNWLQRVRRHAQVHWKKVEIPFFLPANGDLTPTHFKSLPDFFQLLADNSLEPRSIVISTLPSDDPDDKRTPTIASLEATGKDLKIILAKLKKTNLNAQQKTYLQMVAVAADLMDAESWPYLRKAQLTDLCDVKERPDVWKPLFNDDFDLAVELLKLLNQAQEIIEKLEA